MFDERRLFTFFRLTFCVLIPKYIDSRILIMLLRNMQHGHTAITFGVLVPETGNAASVQAKGSVSAKRDRDVPGYPESAKCNNS
jgi:hypothetical protein